MTVQTRTLARSEWLPDLAYACLFLILAVTVPAVAIAILVVPRLRTRLQAAFTILTIEFYQDKRWPILLVLTAIVANLAARHPFPPDDLSRDLVAWLYQFDYRKMFWASPLVPPYNPYWGFDHLAQLAWPLPFEWRALPFQLLPLLILLGTLLLVLRKTLEGHVQRNLMIALLLLGVVLMPGESTRITQGRPEVLFSSLMFTVWILPEWLWILLMVACAPLYWISPVYAAGAMLMNRYSWKTRLVITGGLGLVMGAEWLVVTDGQWLEGLSYLARAGHNRVSGVSENETILKIGTFMTGLIALGLLYRLRDRFSIEKDADLVAAILFFMLPNQVRYTSVVSPLLIVLMARLIARGNPLPDGTALTLRILTIWGSAFMLSGAFASPTAPPETYLSNVKPGDKILAPFEPAMYRAIYAAASHGGLIAPAMEVGMTDQKVQRMAHDLHQGIIDCAGLAELKVNWVVEDGLIGPPPTCLQFDSADGPNRAWKVLPKDVQPHT